MSIFKDAIDNAFDLVNNLIDENVKAGAMKKPKKARVFFKSNPDKTRQTSIFLQNDPDKDGTQLAFTTDDYVFPPTWQEDPEPSLKQVQTWKRMDEDTKKNAKLIAQQFAGTGMSMKAYNYVENQLKLWLNTEEANKMFAEILSWSNEYEHREFKETWQILLDNQRKQFKKEYRREKEMTQPTLISPKLAELVKASDSWYNFNCLLTDQDNYRELFSELLTIYGEYAKDINGWSAEKCAYTHLVVNGYEIEVPKKYRIILPDLHRTSTGSNWNYIYISALGAVRGSDFISGVELVTDEELTKLPAWVKAYAKEA